jgi:hypothetical protein
MTHDMKARKTRMEGQWFGIPSIRHFISWVTALLSGAWQSVAAGAAKEF